MTELLHDALKQLDTATQRLIGANTGHGGHWAPSLWTQMVEAMDEKGNGKAGARTAGAPVNLAIVDWVHEVETVTRGWIGERMAPHDILDMLCAVDRWRPQDADTIVNMADTVHSWCRQAEEMLAPRSVLDVQGACPECDTTTVYRPNQYGENCKTAALKVNTDGCVCLECGTKWGREQLGLLATVLGA